MSAAMVIPGLSLSGWELDAACAAPVPGVVRMGEIDVPVGSEAWFSEGNSRIVEVAVAVCGRCPVQLECLERALEFEGGSGAASRHGVWGGLLPEERATLARARSRARSAAAGVGVG